MRINVLQHTPDEGPGTIADWSKRNGHEMTVYHPAHFSGVLPKEEHTARNKLPKYWGIPSVRLPIKKLVGRQFADRVSEFQVYLIK